MSDTLLTMSNKLLSMLFAGIVTAYCLWVCSLPLFPSQDGAVHLYYTSVISGLLSSSSPFSQFFVIRYPIPPYSFHYLLLIGLTHFLGPLIAEKCVVCLIIIAFCYGFRFLIRTIDPSKDIFAIFAVPLSLNWSLGMGFHNYCLSLAFSLWAIGLWLRAVKTGALRLRILFLAVAFLMLFTHPVPLFILLAFIAGETLLRAAQTCLSAKRDSVAQPLGNVLRKYQADAITVALAFLSVAYIALFVDTQQTTENLHHRLIQPRMILDAVRLTPLVLTYGGLSGLAYRIFLYALLGGALWAGVRGLGTRWKALNLRPTDLMLIGAMMLGIFYPMLPRSMNGSDYFTDRLMVYIWLFAMLAAADRLNLTGHDKWRTALAASIVALLVLVMTDREMRPTASNLEKIETAHIVAPGSRGIFIDAPIEPETGKLTFNPFIWSSARYFRRAHAVILNAPWLDQRHMPLGPAPKLFTNIFPPQVLNRPDRFAGLLIQSRKARDVVSSDADFIVFIGQSNRDPKVVDNVLRQEWPHQWTCRRTGWYSVCADPDKSIGSPVN